MMNPSPEAIRQEFVTQSAIAPDVFEAAVRLLPDLEIDPIDPIAQEVVSTPLHDALNWHYTRFGWQATPNLIGAGFYQESGELWQAKVYGQKAGERTGSYYAPKGIGDRAYLPPVSQPIADQIAAKYDLEPPNLEQESFWGWLQGLTADEKARIPLIITEGGKKALAALSLGFPAISVYGCRCFPNELKELAEGFDCLIAFDRDTKKTAKKAVHRGIRKLGAGLTGIASQVRVVIWDKELGKGIDDLIANQGGEYFELVINKAQSFTDWSLKKFIDLSPHVNLRIDERYIPDSLNPPENAQIIGLKSAKGTGKTEWLASQVESALGEGRPVIVLVHRQQLAKELGNRIGVEYRTEITQVGRMAGYALCIDSLHGKANPPFQPEHWENALVILDEAEQVIRHLLNSPTCQRNRVAILETFHHLIEQTIETGGKIYLSDADLSPIALNYVKGLAGDDAQAWVVENVHKPIQGKRELTTFSKAETLLSETLESVGKGEKILIQTSAQKPKSKWGTINLEKLLTNEFPDRKILRIDSESISEPEHPACGVMGNLNTVVPLYDVVVASPSLETGTSITCNHFDKVFCFALGVQTVDAVCQALARVRSDVPRFIYAVKRSPSRIGNGSISPFSIQSTENDKANRLLNQTKSQLEAADFELNLDGLPPQNIQTWANQAAVSNAGWKDYRDSILDKLANEGYRVKEYEYPPNREEDTPAPPAEGEKQYTPGKAKELAKQVSEASHAEYCEAVAAAPNPDDKELEQLKEKRAKTEAERLKQRKGELSRRYLTEKITPEVVEKDDDGWYQKILIHYYLTQGRDYVESRDSARLEKILESGKGKVFIPDANRATLSTKIHALEVIGIPDFLGFTKEFSKEPLQDWFSKFDHPKVKSQLKGILGVTVRQNDTPIAFANRILDTMGLKLTLDRQENLEDGKKQRVYLGAAFPSDGRNEVFARWLERDEKLYQDDTKWNITSIKSITHTTASGVPNPQQQEGEVA